jgi:hypothetical protein
VATRTLVLASESETWTALVKVAFGALGLTLLATGPQVPTPDEFPALRGYAFVVGLLLVLWAASARHRPFLAILGCIALCAGLAASIVGDGQPAASRAALALDSGAAILLGAVGRRPWMALPFLLVPLLVVAANPAGFGVSHEAFSESWQGAMGCECLWPGLPAALALVGAGIGEAAARPWVPPRPSAALLAIACTGLLMAAVVLRTVAPPSFEGARLWLGRTGLVAGILGGMALAYQSGRVAYVWQAGAAGLLLLVGQIYADASIVPIVFDTALLATALASLVPAILVAVGLLVRQWIATDRPALAPDQGSPIDIGSFVQEEHAARTVPRPEPLHTGGFGARDRPDEASTGGSQSDGGNE